MSDPETRKVMGNLLDLGLSAGAENIAVSLNWPLVLYKEDLQIFGDEQLISLDENGEWEASLIETDNMESGAHYVFRVNQRIYKRLVPAFASDYQFRDLPVYDC